MKKLLSSLTAFVAFVVLLEIKFPSLSVIISFVELHNKVAFGSLYEYEHTLSKELIYTFPSFSSFLVSAYFLSNSNPFIEQSFTLLKALRISSLKFSDKVSGHVTDNIKFLSVCSIIHIGKIAFRIKSSDISSVELFSSLLFKSNFISNGQSSLSFSFINFFEQKLFTVITEVYLVL